MPEGLLRRFADALRRIVRVGLLDSPRRRFAAPAAFRRSLPLPPPARLARDPDSNCSRASAVRQCACGSYSLNSPTAARALFVRVALQGLDDLLRLGGLVLLRGGRIILLLAEDAKSREIGAGFQYRRNREECYQADSNADHGRPLTVYPLDRPRERQFAVESACKHVTVNDPLRRIRIAAHDRQVRHGLPDRRGRDIVGIGWRNDSSWQRQWPPMPPMPPPLPGPGRNSFFGGGGLYSDSGGLL